MITIRLTLLLIVLSLLVLIMNAFTNSPIGKSEDHKNHWVFVNYHKSGFDLGKHLVEVFQTGPCSANLVKKEKAHVDARQSKIAISKVDIAILSGNDLHFDWNTDLLVPGDESIKYIHQVRDPFDMIVSGYLYHSEVPPPPEDWLLDDDFNPCVMHEYSRLVHYVDTITKLLGMDRNAFYRMIIETKELCEELVDKAYRTSGVKAFNPVLRSFKDPLDGLFLEAARALISEGRGDMLRMATNAIYETKSNNITTSFSVKLSQNHNVSKRVFLADFSEGDIDTFRRSASDMYNFLTANDSQHESPPFWTCLDVPQAVERAVMTAYVDPHHIVKCTNEEKISAIDINDNCRLATHVTRGSGVDRQMYVSALKKHALFGTVLGAVNATIHYY